MWPVILRELRVGSRRWTTYWLRLLAAAVVIMAVLWWLAGHGHSRQSGSLVFSWVHRIVLASIWIIVPLMTCDCLSSEKREGTLGLLFLTNLSSREIVLAKAVAYGWRALTLWLATIPVIAVPLLLGGLTWKEIILSCCFAGSSICGALAVGLLASALGRRSNGAVAGVALLAPIVCLLVVPVMMTVFMTQLHLFDGFWFRPNEDVSFTRWIGFATALFWSADSYWPDLFNRYQAANDLLIGSMAFVPVAVMLLFLFCSFVIAPIIRRNWQDKPRTKRQTEVEKFFCAPSFFPKFFRSWMRHSLENNPIGWLEKRSWTGRITAWIWLAVMISFASGLAYSAVTRMDLQEYNVLMWMLLVSIAYVAAGSFRRERETGALELILVTPLSERHIVFGRLRALWSQFLPTFAIWIAAVLYLSSGLNEWQVANVVRFAVAYLTVPVAGLYFSLRSRFVLLSWLATLAVSFLVPQVLWQMFHLGLRVAWRFAVHRSIFGHIPDTELFIILPAQLGLAGFLLWRLKVNLVRRSFSLS